MQTRLVVSPPVLGSFLAALLLAANAHAQLPNAWQITDNSAAAALFYTNILGSSQQMAATNSGFDFSINARFATNFSGTKAMTMINDSTFSGNSCAADGGAINSSSASVVTLNNGTLYGNSGGLTCAGGIYNALLSTCILTNTIVAGNPPLNIKGSISGANNFTNGNPLLAPLGDYGGMTQTLPPLAGSPVIDAGDDSVTAFLTTDQRGHPRWSGAHVDIGAAEAQYAPANDPLLLTGSAFSGAGGTNSFQFTFTNVPDADFTVLASTNVAPPSSLWTPLGPALQNPPGQYQFTDPDAANYPQRFYRVVSP
jgi:predicted outer membrane repeat protein